MNNNKNKAVSKAKTNYIEQLVNQYIKNNRKENRIVYPEAYSLLAQVQLANKDSFSATQNQAEYLASVGNYPAAVYQLNSLLKFGKLKEYEKKIITVKIKKLKSEYKELRE